MTKVCICADDFGFNSAVNQAILTLAKNNNIQAVSCMVNGDGFTVAHCEQLKGISSCDIGLHLNLTHHFKSNPTAFKIWGLSSLIVASYLRLLSSKKIYLQLKQQWDQYVAIFGTHPQFIDGHQHIHQLPVVRSALIQLLVENNYKGWVRSLSHIQSGGVSRFKCFVLKMLGAKRFEKMLKKNQFHFNGCFAGVYNFDAQTNLSKIWSQWFTDIHQPVLIMCHPATFVFEQDDIGLARQHEYEFLSSESFRSLVEQYAVQLQPQSNAFRKY